MDGYSVKDAALVLGIPERRVWELIARGVLSSSREGPEGMRVFLQPRSTPAESPSPEPRIYRADEPEPQPPQNGNGGSHEMSPFRELLTEFRSLTERYGQALLALGEARGEVAALRTRVELLEARMDLRLPNSRPASTVAWEIPAYPDEEPQEATPEEPVAPDDEAPEAGPLAAEPADAESAELFELDEEPELVAEAEASAAAPEPVPEAAESEPQDQQVETPVQEPPADLTAEPSPGRQRRAASRRRKIKGGRTALVGIAEALARAEDPTLAELPGADEAIQALAALQREIDARREAAPAIEAPVEASVTDAPAAEAPAAEAPAAEAGAMEEQSPPEATEALEEPAVASAPVADDMADIEQPDEPELYATVSMSAVSVPATSLVANED